MSITSKVRTCHDLHLVTADDEQASRSTTSTAIA